jgi:hypothetical protein
MSWKSEGSGLEPAAACYGKSTVRGRWLIALAALGALALGMAFPAGAAAHGPVAPIASSYLAKVSAAPAGLAAKVVDGDQRMWLQVRRGLTVVVLDYRGAPYLRFSAQVVQVNQNSAMYYLNQTPALTPPANLSPRTRPSWHQVRGGSSYSWHDGRLHALAAVALAPGTSFVGRWRVPVVVDGQLAAISGDLWHADSPSIVWFWPIVVLLACVLAAWRLRRPELDRSLARALGIGALIALSVAVLVRELHGRPTVSVFQMLELVVVLAFAVWGLHRVLFARHGYFTYFVIALVALWQGIQLTPTLLEGFVLAAGPAVVARAAAVVCLGTSISLLLLVFRLSDLQNASRAPGREPTEELEGEDDSAWELA